MVRVAINGFGRIGRQVLQAGINDPAIEWVAVNDLTDTKTLAYLLKYDSVHGISPYPVHYDEKHLIVNGRKILVCSEKDPAKLPWKKLKVDVVVESTGLFTDGEKAKVHLSAGAKKVLISSPGANVDITLVHGVNDKAYNAKKHNIISNASCTTNCLAPIVDVLHRHFGVKHGFMVTAHAYTSDQCIVDASHSNARHHDLRMTRSAAVSIIPTTTGAARTVAEVIPALKGKLDGFAWRVPVPDGSIVNFTAELSKKATVEKINTVFKAESKRLAGILQYTEEPLVSRDIIHNSHSCIFDALSTKMIGEKFISVSGWYDNEWGYACRVVDVVKRL